jgi:hypothetical protein
MLGETLSHYRIGEVLATSSNPALSSPMPSASIGIGDRIEELLPARFALKCSAGGMARVARCDVSPRFQLVNFLFSHPHRLDLGLQRLRHETSVRLKPCFISRRIDLHFSVFPWQQT